jgi:NADPH:quinone reductase-like Zn-dependent oxidoreductase
MPATPLAMRAIIQDGYGPPERVLRLEEVPVPPVGAGDVLIRMRATSVNAPDWATVTGVPYIGRLSHGLRRPKRPVRGSDVAGVVEAAGAGVSDLAPGDEVLGTTGLARAGAFAQYVAVPAAQLVKKPAELTFSDAAASVMTGLAALVAMRDVAQAGAGTRVLINGASGGVGTMAVQIAKVLGAEVTGVCGSARNIELVRILGADHVIDYTQEDFTRTGQRYDLLLDIAGNRSWSECKRVLTPNATLVVVGGPKANRWIGPLGGLAKLRLAALRSSQKVTFFLASITKADLLVLQELLEAGTVTPVIDRRYGLGEVADAFRYLGEGHAQGKVVVSVTDGPF